MKSMLARIDDRAMYSGTYVKEMLKSLGAGEEVVRWMELPDAAVVLKRRPDTLRKQCARWSEMADPVIRVRKKGPAEGAHWLLCEQDVYAAVKRPLTLHEPATSTEEDGTKVSPASGREGPGEDDEDATVAKWCSLATENYA